MNDEEWIDVTTFGSQYQEQTSTRGRWRHRPVRLAFRGDSSSPMIADEGQWLQGPAPKMPS